MEKRKNKTRLARAAMTLLVMLFCFTGARAQLFSENFEGGSMPEGWTTDGPVTWSVGTGDYSTSTGAGQGSYNARITHSTTGNVTKLITPEIDLSSVTSAELSFMYVMRSWASDTDELRVYYRASSSGEWTMLAEYTAAVSTWTAVGEIVLPNLSSTYQIAFEMTDNYGYGVGIDDVKIVQGASCPNPVSLSATLTPGDGTVATLSWTETGEATQWQICLNDDEENLIAAGTNPFTLTGLTAETAYTAKVRSYCDAENQSRWSDPVTFTPTDVYSITVNDGTAQNGYVPIYGYCVDNITKSQFIIPASALGDMQYGTINKLTFYSSNADVDWGNAEFEVYMTETNETTLSALVDYGTMEKVKNAGSLSISGNKMEVTLDAPYQYLGGNLMIGFLQTTKGSYVSCNWYGVAATGASMGGYGTSVNQQIFLPKTTFEYEPGVAPACAKPKGLTVNYTGGTTAEVSWTSDATAWNIYVNGTVTAITENPYTLTGLELATTYEVKVQASCGEEETSDWTNPVSFTTDPCLPEDMCEITFELTDSYGDGWNGAAIQVVDVETNDVIATMTADSHGGGDVSSTDIKTLKLCNGREIRFKWNSGSFDSECSYVVKDINEEVIFQGSGAMSAQVTHTVNCSGCKKPSNLAETNITTNSATLSWDGTSDSYLLQYRPWNPAGDDIITTGAMVTYTVDLSQYEGTGSVAIRHYDISDMFQLIVDNIEVTNASGTVVYSQDFESCGGDMPSEFSNMDLDGDGYMWKIASSSSSYVDGTYGIVSASYDNSAGALTPDNWLIVSGIEMGGQMTFQARGQDPAYAAENFAIYVSTENSIVEVPVTATTYNATNLTPNTPYAWQVKGICGDEETNYASSFFKTKDDMLVFATDGDWDELSNWKDAEGNAATALPTNENNVRIDAEATIPSGVVALANKATLGTGGSITIKDGGQLKQNAATLRVTMEKEIPGYGESDGNYYFIASPFNGRTLYSESGSFSFVNNMLTGEYDLSAFDAAASDGLEWINYKSESTHLAFQAENGLAGLLYSEGYLYANQEGTTLEFIGTTGKSNNYSESREYTYDDTSEDVFNGWVMVGNMFTCNGYVTYSGDATFYKLNAAGDGFEAFEGGVELAPAEGAFMKVSASGTITFSSEAPEGFNSTSTSAAGLLPILPSHGEEDNQDANLSEEIVNITFAKEGFATYYNGAKDVVLTTGMKAHVVTEGGSSLTYAEVADGDTDGNVVPAGTAVLLEVEPSTAAQTLSVYLVESSADPYEGTNLLFGSDEATETTGGVKYYKLTYSNNNDKFGWYWGAADGGAFTSPAHKAWLALSASSARSFLGLPDWQDATGIAPVSIDFENGEWYTLQGLKIGKKPTSAGVYIHNGRKVVVK